MRTMTIGAVARAAGVGIETIRYYERLGLLAPPPRSPSGYRRYPPETVETLGFIKRSQRLGFTLTEIAELLALHHEPVPCDEVKQRATRKVAEIDAKIAALDAVKDDLLTLIARCDTECGTSCTALNGDGQATGVASSCPPAHCGGEGESHCVPAALAEANCASG